VADSSLLRASVSFSSSQLLSIMPIFVAAGVLRVRNCRVTSLISDSAGPLSTFTPIAHRWPPSLTVGMGFGDGASCEGRAGGAAA
jgi:hypothetical protein